MPLAVEDFSKLVTRYKADRESVYNTWFIDNETRLKAFRSIRLGVQGQEQRSAGTVLPTQTKNNGS